MKSYLGCKKNERIKLTDCWFHYFGTRSSQIGTSLVFLVRCLFFYLTSLHFTLRVTVINFKCFQISHVKRYLLLLNRGTRRLISRSWQPSDFDFGCGSHRCKSKSPTGQKDIDGWMDRCRCPSNYPFSSLCRGLSLCCRWEHCLIGEIGTYHHMS